MQPRHDNINSFLYTPGKYFKIPDFQRPYSWDKANIVSLLQDIELVITQNKKHFFGSIVFINEGHDSTIIDGQQRATTVLLMLTALCHIIKDDPSTSSISAEQIEDMYLYNRQDYSEEKNRIKLRTVTTDNKIFEEIFERRNFSDNSKDSKLYQAYAYFLEYFRVRRNLERYIKVLENFEIVTIALDASDDNPQKIFESINSTGKPLTDGDKIRNFALMLNDSSARKLVLENYWKKIETELTDVNKDYISDFFKYHLTSILQKEVKVEQVYSEFKNLFSSVIGDDQSNEAKLEKFYGQVIDYLNNYVFLKFNRDEEKLFETVSDQGFRLNYLKIETPFPFLMRVLDKFEKGELSSGEVKEIFNTIETYLTRRILCNIFTTGLNKFFSTLHKDIENYIQKDQSESYVEVFKYILINKAGDLRIPKEIEIENAIKNNPFYTQRNTNILFVLTSVDDQSHESKLLKQLATGEMKDLSIEHIMPQTLNRQWKSDLGENYEEIHSQYLHTLANLTLTGYNSKYSNNDFATKKTTDNGFNESPLVINQYMKTQEKWNLEALENRANWWMKQIEKIWPFPESNFTPEIEETELLFTDDADLTGASIKAIEVLGEVHECKSWIDALDFILRKFFELEPNIFDFIISDEFLSRYIKSNQDLLSPRKLEGTNYYYEAHSNTNLKKSLIIRLAEHLELDKTDIKVILKQQESTIIKVCEE